MIPTRSIGEVSFWINSKSELVTVKMKIDFKGQAYCNYKCIIQHVLNERINGKTQQPEDNMEELKLMHQEK